VTSNLFFLLQAPAAGGSGGSMFFLIQMVVIVAIFYFIVIRPQRKQQRELEAQLTALAKGDTIITAGGLVGEVVHIKDTYVDGKSAPGMSDHVTVKSGESKVVVERGRITRVDKAGAK